MTTCTSSKYEWKRRSGNSDYATPLKDLRIVKAEFSKSEKNPIKPHDFDPWPSFLDPVSMRGKLRRGLQQLHPESVANQFLPKPKDPVIPEPAVAEHISNNANVERFETVESVSVYTMKYAEIFKCQNNISINGDIYEETRQSFIKFLTIDKNQCDIICCKTIHQGSSKFWYDQRSGRFMASNFYRICHMRESTQKSNIVKSLMNYCPMEHVPEQLQWGHEKEIAASELYLKKISKKHNKVSLVESGLIINQKWPFLGTSPDKIPHCKCHGKTLVECKSLCLQKGICCLELQLQTSCLKQPHASSLKKKCPGIAKSRPNGNFKNSCHWSSYLHKQRYFNCPCGIQCRILAADFWTSSRCFLLSLWFQSFLLDKFYVKLGYK